MKEERDVDKMKGERERDKIGSDFFWGMGKHSTGPDRAVESIQLPLLRLLIIVKSVRLDYIQPDLFYHKELVAVTSNYEWEGNHCDD
jgi:hypothetical protein